MNFRQIAAVVMIVFIPACSLENLSEPSYFKTFKHIKTDQFNSSYGNRGIYWVSSDEVVLEALVNNQRGIYQVNVNDGSYIQRVSINTEQHLFSYCFADGVLYLSGKEKLKVVSQPQGYFIVQKGGAEKLVGRTMWAALGCKGMVRPIDDGGYIALNEEDGFIKNQYIKSKDDDVEVYLADRNGNNVKRLLKRPPGSKGVHGLARFLAHSDTYFGAYSQHGCSSIWWLDRETWNLLDKDICFGEWAKNGSNIVLSTAAGLFVENHNTKKPFAYLIENGNEHLVSDTGLRGSSLGFDGCRVAYGFGSFRSRDGGADYRQVLQVFNACKYIEETRSKG